MHKDYSFQLLAPPQCHTGGLSRTIVDPQSYGHYLSSMQRLRGQVYLKDRAIQPWELDDDGRFHMQADSRSWHFLLTADAEVVGCARYLVHPNTVSFDRLRISHSALAQDPQWKDKVRRAVETDLERARQQNFSYVEIGGWALAEQWRGTAAALEILVASYALGNLWGGCLGACMATVRHSSSSILRRIGGSSFSVSGESLPVYDDPRYGCQMELLRFDSRAPAERFIPLVNQLKRQLRNVAPISRSAPQPWEMVPHELTAEQLRLSRMAAFYC